MKPYLLRVLRIGGICYTKKHNYFDGIKLKGKGEENLYEKIDSVILMRSSINMFCSCYACHGC